MKEADLFKESTLEDAEYPQEDKYNSGTVLFSGAVSDASPLEVGSKVLMYATNQLRGFTTSTIKEVLERTDEYVKFKTRNSVYKLIWKK